MFEGGGNAGTISRRGIDNMASNKLKRTIDYRWVVACYCFVHLGGAHAMVVMEVTNRPGETPWPTRLRIHNYYRVPRFKSCKALSSTLIQLTLERR